YNHYVYKDSITGSQIEIIKNPFKFVIKDNKGNILLGSYQDILNYLEWQDYFDGRINISLRFQTESQNFYGFGEKYDRLNQKGLQPDICVYNRYTNQQSRTYIPIPFFFTENGYGMYIKSSQYLKFDLCNKLENLIEIKGRLNKCNPALELYILFGEPRKILTDYLSLTGFPSLPSKWAFGPWMSANSWNTQREILKQVKAMNKFKIPATVLVIEAWSDEITFYIFNDAICKSKLGAQKFSYKNFDFSEKGKWPNPKGMIDLIHKNNLKIILWQIPIINKYFEEGTKNEQHIQDESYAIEKGFCVMNEDGTPYRIPYGWFANSLLLDFSNPEAKEWWFNKRRYLIEDLSVDGFKTDGGEFIFDDNLTFYNGLKGDEMRNLYPLNYIAAYNEFIGKDRVTFSRAGFTGAQKYSLYWGGDQLSSFETLKSLIIAGLSINISGIPFWGWDIAGFSGEIPTAELFIRSTQMAVFCPIMQFHSDTQNSNWDRTPWNIAERNEDKRALEIYRDYANLRMNILPYIYNEAIHVAEKGEPMMRPLVFDYTDDKRVYDIEDEYLFGRFLLVAPVTEEGQRQREIYLPEGEWIDFWNGTKYNGQQYIRYICDLDKIPVFIKNNSVVPFNLNNNFKSGGYVGNRVDLYHNLCFMMVGEIKEKYIFRDDLGNKILFTQKNGKIKVDILGKIDEIYIISSKPLSLEGYVAERMVKQNLNIYKIINL
ncbi:MAG: glycosyl hydrolase family 31, partial [Candidatus Atribacteria bacterium]|nr:glycosyl hydrolase family 31 [Candidatus Atribacteria bacterium]